MNLNDEGDEARGIIFMYMPEIELNDQDGEQQVVKMDHDDHQRSKHYL